LVAPTTNTDPPLPDFNKLVIEPDEEVLNSCRNILDVEESKCYRQVINRPDDDIWDSAIVAEINGLRRDHTWDVVDRPRDRKIVDSKLIFKIKHLFDGSVDKFKPQFMAKRFSKFRDRIPL
jgi:hypothetical protein